MAHSQSKSISRVERNQSAGKCPCSVLREIGKFEVITIDDVIKSQDPLFIAKAQSEHLMIFLNHPSRSPAYHHSCLRKCNTYNIARFLMHNPEKDILYNDNFPSQAPNQPRDKNILPILPAQAVVVSLTSRLNSPTPGKIWEMNPSTVISEIGISNCLLNTEKLVWIYTLSAFFEIGG